MNLERIKELETTDAKLTAAEMLEGWHFCLEWDGMLCHPDSPEAEVCGCPLRTEDMTTDYFNEDKKD